MFKIETLKLGLARLLSRLYHLIADSKVESLLSDRRDYEFYQGQRRRTIENYLSKYLGPKL